MHLWGVKGREQGLPVSPGAYGPVPRPDVTLTADPAVTATFVVCPLRWIFSAEKFAAQGCVSWC